MELHSRFKSAPQLRKLDDVTYILEESGTMSEGEYEECTEDERFNSEMDDEKSVDMDNKSVSDDSVTNTLLNPNVHPCFSEQEVSPILPRKKRQAPLPPVMSPTTAARHKYAFDSSALRLRTSTDTESSTDSRYFYQTSTDSDNIVIPESARGSNFPGELAGVDNLHSLKSHRPRSADSTFIVSPRGHFPFHKIRDAFRSPQIVRRKTTKVKNAQKIEQVKKNKDGYSFVSKSKKPKSDNRVKSPNPKEIRNYEPLPEMTEWVLIGGFQELVADNEFEVTRITNFETHLKSLLEVTDPSQQDHDEISKCLGKVQKMMEDRGEEAKQNTADVISSDLTDTVASATDVNPETNNSGNMETASSRNLNVGSSKEDMHKQTTKRKGLSLRRRSAPSAILFKTNSSVRPKSSNIPLINSFPGRRDHEVITQMKLEDGNSNREFVMEGSVQFLTGMQVQERYLFLFSDILLVTKQKSSTTFKLKHKVHLCDMWIASCIDEVSETTTPLDRSFVLGWPITNVVATFAKTELKDDWLNNLRTHITKEQLKDENKTIQLNVTLKDIDSTSCRHCQVTINTFTQVNDVILDCLRQINVLENEVKKYQLWGIMEKVSTPYPLIGHETPFSIKQSQARDLPRSKSGNDLDSMTSEELDSVVGSRSSSTGEKCEFYLAPRKPLRKHNFEDTSHQKNLIKKKRSPKILKIFRKRKANQNLVFGVPLAEVCNENLDLPDAIVKLIVLVYQHGPHVPGILRKSNNYALGKDIRKKIDSGEKYTLDDEMAPTAASVFKEFLRVIPDGLLLNSLRDQWLSFKNDDPYDEKIKKIKTILAKLPPVNYNILKLTICLLQHLAKFSSKNHMGQSNLATCIAPSLYTHEVIELSHGKSDGSNQKLIQDSMSEIRYIIVPLIAFMITNHTELFGQDILNMFVKYGCQPSPAVELEDDERYNDGQIQPSAEEDEDDDMIEEEDDNFSEQCSNNPLKMEKPDHHGLNQSNSGTDSDSMHSVLSMQDARMGLQRDDSSIDSLGEREYDTHGSPRTMKKSHLSPTNLSKDSGLTLSDNQLYDEEAAYQADIASTSVKMFHQMPHPFTDRDAVDIGNPNIHADFNTDKTYSPVPPPRKLSIRRKMLKVADSDNKKLENADFSTQHASPTNNMSVTHIYNNQIQHDTNQRSYAHSSLNKRFSVDSIGEEKEDANIQCQPSDFSEMRKGIDLGTLTKSESGARLFFNDDNLNSENCLVTSKNIAGYPFLGQLPDSGNLVTALSPDLRHSQSSCDSVISDSTYSISCDESINSSPLTPEETLDSSINWVPDITLPDKPWKEFDWTQKSYTKNKSATDILHKQEIDRENILTSEHSTKFNSQKDCSGRGLNSEMTEITCSSQFSPIHKPVYCEISMDRQHQSTQAFQDDSTLTRKHKHTQARSSSPPPGIILQTLPPPSKKDFVPIKSENNWPQRRLSVDSLELRHSTTAPEMQAIKPEDYVYAMSKPIIISPESSSLNSASSANYRAKLSKYMKDTQMKDLPSQLKDSDFVHVKNSGQFADMLPRYQQMVKRNLVMKSDTPNDVTESQIESSARAKRMYEQSLQQYNEQIQNKPFDIPSDITKSNMNLAANFDLVYAQKSKAEKSTTINNSKVLKEYNVLSDQAKSDSFPQKFNSDISDDYCASEFSDMGSISQCLQELDTQNNSLGMPVSLSRSGSKLSDTSSSSGSSSATISTLGKHSDSFAGHSDLSNTSNITVSSVTSSDSNPEFYSEVSKSKHVGGIKQHSNLMKNIREYEVHEKSSVAKNGSSVAVEKNPEDIYLASKQIYEQSKTLEMYPHASTQNKPHLLLPSYPTLPRQQSPDTLLGSLPFTDNIRHTTSVAGQHNSHSNLQVHSVNLHRSCSDASEHKHKLGAYSHRSTNTVHIIQEKNKRLEKHNNSEDSDISPDQNIITQLHDNFVRARSRFHQPDIIDSQLPSKLSHSIPKSVHQFPAVVDNKPKNMAAFNNKPKNMANVDKKPKDMPRTASSVPGTNNTTTESPQVTKSNTATKTPASSIPQDKKSEFHWSVKDLLSNFDKDTKRSVEGSSTSQLSHSRPHTPPPYQNPPPFRRQDSSRHTVCNSSSSGREQTSSDNKIPSKAGTSHRQGPQSCTYAHTNYTYSSSDESYSSSPDRHSTWLSNSSLDDEQLSDYSNTTYI